MYKSLKIKEIFNDNYRNYMGMTPQTRGLGCGVGLSAVSFGVSLEKNETPKGCRFYPSCGFGFHKK